MAPIRRYLRITKYSVLEVRIYLDNPALAQSWLLNPRNPMLPRVMESVRPLVLPKLREEQERSRTRRKGAKKRNIKDVVVQGTCIQGVCRRGSGSNSSKLTGASHHAPIDVDTNPCPVVLDEEDDDELTPPGLRREYGDSADALTSIPATTEPQQQSRAKRRRGRPYLEKAEQEEGQGREDDAMNDADDDDEDVFVENSESEDSDLQPPPPKRARDMRHAAAGDGDEETGDKEAGDKETGDKDDTKKKMAMDISYNGFALYGRVLCLVVRRRQSQHLGAGNRAGATTTLVRGGKGASAAGGGQAQMENWITSTQMVPAAADDGDTDAT